MEENFRILQQQIMEYSKVLEDMLISVEDISNKLEEKISTLEKHTLDRIQNLKQEFPLHLKELVFEKYDQERKLNPNFRW